MDSRTYWNNNIERWEDSWQGTGRAPLLERVGARFRRPLRFRGECAHALLAPRVHGKHVLELGAGSAFFAFRLFEQARPRHYTCLDISERAVQRARALAARKGIARYFTIEQADITALDALPRADVMVGLGFLDYLTIDDIRQLFAQLPCPHFLASVPERDASWLRLLHILYMRWQRCPQHDYFSKDQIRQAVGGRFGQLTCVEDGRLGFAFLVHNFSA